MKKAKSPCDCKEKIKIKEKGITLIALAITIVLLLIFAGVTLNLVVGQGGLINRAKRSVGKYQEASKNEQDTLDQYSESIDEITSQYEISAEMTGDGEYTIALNDKSREADNKKTTFSKIYSMNFNTNQWEDRSDSIQNNQDQYLDKSEKLIEFQYSLAKFNNGECKFKIVKDGKSYIYNLNYIVTSYGGYTNGFTRVKLYDVKERKFTTFENAYVYFGNYYRNIEWGWIDVSSQIHGSAIFGTEYNYLVGDISMWQFTTKTTEGYAFSGNYNVKIIKDGKEYSGIGNFACNLVW